MNRQPTYEELREKVKRLEKRVAQLEQTENELRISEARFRAAINSIPFDLFVLENEGRYSIQNKASRKNWGNIVGKRPQDLDVDKKTLALWERSNRTARKGETVKDKVQVSVGGKLKYFYNIISPVVEGKTHLGILGLNIDITDLKRVEEKLQEANNTLEKEVKKRTRELTKANAKLKNELKRSRQLKQMHNKSEQRYRVLFEHSPICLCEVDASAVEHYFKYLKKRGVKDIREYFDSHPEALKRNLSKFKPVDANNEALKVFEEAKDKVQLLYDHANTLTDETYFAVKEGLIALAEGKKSFQCEITGQTLDNNHKHFFFAYAKIPAQESKQPRLLFAFVDVTRRKAAEEELKNFKTISDESSIGNVIVNLNGNLIYLNESAAHMHGYTVEEMRGKHYLSFHTEDQVPAMKRIQQKVLKDGRIRNEAIWRIRKDGTVFPTIINAKLMTDEQGKPLYIASSAIDITERIQLDKELQEREKELRAKNQSLEETNAALKVLLRMREKDKATIEKRFLRNVRELVHPFIGKLKQTELRGEQAAYVDVLESNLKQIVSPFTESLGSRVESLSPRELRIASLVKDGNTTKEIAQLLGLSKRTVDAYRDRLRKKLGMKEKKTNLRTVLLSFQIPNIA